MKEILNCINNNAIVASLITLIVSTLILVIFRRNDRKYNENEYPDFLDMDKVTYNIKHGFIAITQLIIFLESFFNTIINKCMLKNNELLLKMNINEKLEVICLYYKKEPCLIKSKNFWDTYLKLNRIRNELIHYKDSLINESSAIQDFKIGNISVKEIFIKSKMKKNYKHIIKLTEHIANILELKINKKINIIECDAKDSLTDYVYDQKKLDLEEDDFTYDDLD